MTNFNFFDVKMNKSYAEHNIFDCSGINVYSSINRGHFHDFWKNHKITSRLMRSMRNDITRVALVATEPETVQNMVF